MGEFIEIKVNDLVKPERPICYGVLKPGEDSPEGVILIKITDISNNHVLKEERLFRISNNLDNEFKRSRLNGGELLISIQGTIGRCCIVPEKLRGANISRTIARLDIKPDYDTEYIYQYLASIYGQRLFKNAVLGTTRDSLNIGALREIKLRVPKSKSEQTCIARLLNKVDEAITQTEALILKQQRLKTGLLKDLLTKGIDENGNIRSDAIHKFKVSPLGKIPKEWDVVRLGAIENLITSGPRGWAKYYSREGALFLRIGNLTREHINLRLDSLIHVNPPKTTEGVRTALEEDDVLISITADLGIIGVIPPNFGEAFVNQHIALVRLNKEKILPRWVAHYLSGPAGRYQFQKLNDSGAKAGLNLPTVTQLCVAQPKNKDEQQFISDVLDHCAESIDAENKILAKYQSLKQGLMQDLLTGEVSVEILLEEHITASS